MDTANIMDIFISRFQRQMMTACSMTVYIKML